MMRHKHGYDHRCQLHASPEDRGAASMFDRFNNFFFLFYFDKEKNSHGIK
jgi:hypothetical protein